MAISYENALNEVRSSYQEHHGKINVDMSKDTYAAVEDALEYMTLLGVTRNGEDGCESCRV